MKLPFWKVKRELRRLALQISGIPWIFLSPLIRRIYDKNKSRYIRVTEGHVSPQSEFAVLLVFQPKGLLESTLRTLAYLSANGISPLVVSNSALSERDREKLIPYAWQILERPNLGYDFGGYRDGILHILELNLSPDRIIVLNDSIWFPLRGDSDLIEKARSTDADVFGFVMNDRNDAKARHHIQSYFFSFGGKLVAQAEFKDYWRHLFLTNNKYLVVRRCEIPMTDTFRKLGYAIAACHNYTDAALALKSLDNEKLRKVMEYQGSVDASGFKNFQRHLAAKEFDEKWRADVMQDVDAGAFNKYFLIAHPTILFEILRVPILKKDRQKIYQFQRAEIVGGNFDNEFDPVIRDEIRRWDEE